MESLFILSVQAILYLLDDMRIPLSIGILLALAIGTLWAQDSFQLSIDVPLVTVGVEVTDSNDRPVTNLTRNDFQIYEDGEAQELKSFDSVEAPYSILLLFDCSSSTEPNWPFLLEAMNRFRQTLRPQDRIAVAQFGSGFKMLRRWTDASTGATIQASDAVCSGTDFYGAVRQALEELEPVRGRKGVVILTDGAHQQIPFQRGRSENSRPNASSRYVDAVDDSDFQRVLRTASRGANVLYFVAVDTDINPDGGRGATTVGAGLFDPDDIFNKQQIRSRMEQLASATGGRAVYPEKPDDVVRLYEKMAQELGSLYSLGYVPATSKQKDGAYHKIEVRLRDRSLRLRQSRDGYLAR